MNSAACQRCGQPLIQLSRSSLCGICALPEWPGDRTLQRELSALTGAELVDGMADEAVYTARQPSLQRPVSLTLIRKTPDVSDLHYQERSRQWACLHHPFIPALHDYGLLESHPYIISTPLPSVHLSDALHDHSWTDHDCQRLMSDLCEAIQHAHSNGVVHGNLRAEHVLLTDDFHPNVVGWLHTPAQSIGSDTQSDLTALLELGDQLFQHATKDLQTQFQALRSHAFDDVAELLTALTAAQSARRRRWFGR